MKSYRTPHLSTVRSVCCFLFLITAVLATWALCMSAWGPAAAALFVCYLCWRAM